jgi:hypothetical protein
LWENYKEFIIKYFDLVCSCIFVKNFVGTTSNFESILYYVLFKIIIIKNNCLEGKCWIFILYQVLVKLAINIKKQKLNL